MADRVLWQLYGDGLINAAQSGVDALKTRQLSEALGGVDLTTPDGALEASRQLFKMGRANEAMTIAQLGMQERNRREQLDISRGGLDVQRQQANQSGENQRQMREAEDRRLAQLADYQNQTLGIQRQQANRKEGPKVEFVDDGSGGKKPVRIFPDGRVEDVQIIGPNGNPSQPNPNNPYGGGKFNNDQGKAAGFTDRMLQSEGILSGVGGVPGVSDAPTGYQGMWDRSAATIPLVGNFLVSDKYQKYEQAQRDFVNAQLRRESGAAISPSEFDSAKKQYFPQPGDSPDVIKQKAENRRASVEAMGRESGPSYKPRYIFDDAGRVVPFQGGPPKGQAQPNSRPAQVQPSKVPGPAPAGFPEGRTGTFNGKRVIVRNGQIELAE
jgi:hypothetical protein